MRTLQEDKEQFGFKYGNIAVEAIVRCCDFLTLFVVSMSAPLSRRSLTTSRSPLFEALLRAFHPVYMSCYVMSCISFVRSHDFSFINPYKQFIARKEQQSLSGLAVLWVVSWPMLWDREHHWQWQSYTASLVISLDHFILLCSVGWFLTCIDINFTLFNALSGK